MTTLEMQASSSGTGALAGAVTQPTSVLQTTPLVSTLVNRWDHIEWATQDISKLEKLFEVFGFITSQTRKTPTLDQKLMVQGQTRFLVTQGTQGTFQYEYAHKHGDGVCAIAYHTPDAKKTLATALERGATQVSAYISEEEVGPMGPVRMGVASISSFGDVRSTFVERTLTQPFDVLAPFAPGFRKVEGVDPTKHKGLGLLSLDHLTNNVEMGAMNTWSKFYQEIFGWIEARYFDIRAEQTGLFSKVLQSPDGAVKIPVNEATEKKSQVQEFIEQHRGAGVQHIALTTTDICGTVAELRKRGIRVLDIPPEYYSKDVPTRNVKFKEDIEKLRELQILVDGDEKGYLLQLFTENQVGPFFFEIIQRVGHNGFGEGNFKALFESIERDQRRRGVL
jgi:4-hydroxyphenylpyruvate dioxygenase